MKTLTLEVRCAGDEDKLVEYLKLIVIPQLEQGFVRGSEAWYKRWSVDEELEGERQ